MNHLRMTRVLNNIMFNKIRLLTESNNSSMVNTKGEDIF